MPPVITLLTDFGAASAYPAQMKGVICSRCPDARIVDISHDVPRHDVRTAAFMLAACTGAFPPNTVHVAVVDPQVGTCRRVLAVQAEGQAFVAPDNGLLTLVARRRLGCHEPKAPVRIVSVENQDFFRNHLSSTFHGRDIFAPVGAALAAGAPLDQLGPDADGIAEFDLHEPRRQGDVVHGEVLYVDSFGNLVTNIHGSLVEGWEPDAVRVHVSGAVINGLSRAYGDVPAGRLLAYVGSAGLVELAVNRQSAVARLGAYVATPVHVAREEA